jgi:hypothetical protein
MKRPLLLLALAALLAAPASARRDVFPMQNAVSRRDVVRFWFDDLEPADPGWTRGDLTVMISPHFRPSQRMAYSGSYSWWCGTAELTGYGNNWDDRLDVPPITTTAERASWGTIKERYRDEPAPRDGGPLRDPPHPLFSFAYRNDTEPGYDFTYVYDDVESGWLCTPSIPYPAGHYWHVVESMCRAVRGSHVRVNTSVDAPGFVPPGVQNWLMTPLLDLWPVLSCSISFAIQCFTPTVDYDYWAEEATRDGGEHWTQLHVWWGDQCGWGYGPCDHFFVARNVVGFAAPGPRAFRWTYYTTENGAGPGNCGNAGIVPDDIGFRGEPVARGGDPGSWGRVRSLYR